MTNEKERGPAIEPGSRPGKTALEALAFNLAVLLSVVCWMGAVVTFHPDIEAEGLTLTMACGILGSGWIVARWSRVPRAVRPFGWVTVVLTGLALWDAMPRLWS